MNTQVRRGQAIRFRGRSLMAFVLEPSRPTTAWLEEVRGWLDRSPGFFAEKPVLLNVKDVVDTRDDLIALVGELAKLKIRVMGLEGADATWLDDTLPPMIGGSRASSVIEVLPEATAATATEAVAMARPHGKNAAKAAAKAAAQTITPRTSTAPAATVAGLIIDHAVRSGQTITHDGDVTIVGSVASGAEIIAGGSIHVYGTLRGRAVAGNGTGTGTGGNGRARIFARRFEAELLAINGIYRTAEDLGSGPRGHMVQALVEAGALKVDILD